MDEELEKAIRKVGYATRYCRYPRCINTYTILPGDMDKSFCVRRPFFSAPKDPATRKKWFDICGQTYSPTRTIHVCADHFSPEDIVHDSFRRRLKRGTVPLPPPWSLDFVETPKVERLEIVKDRSDKNFLQKENMDLLRGLLETSEGVPKKRMSQADLMSLPVPPLVIIKPPQKPKDFSYWKEFLDKGPSSYEIIVDRSLAVDPHCAVKSCLINQEPYHKFPDPKKEPVLFKLWVSCCGNDELNTLLSERIYQSKRVCAAHFGRGDNVPTLELPVKDNSVAVTALDVTRGADDNVIVYVEDTQSNSFDDALSDSDDVIPEKRIKLEPMDDDYEQTEDELFFIELYEAFLSAEIPLDKLNNPVLTNFLQKYCNRNPIGDSFLYGRYVDKLKNRCLKTIKQDLQTQNYIWVSVEGAVTETGDNVINVVAGGLNADEMPGKSHFINSEVVQKLDAHTVAEIVDSSLDLIYDDRLVKRKALHYLIDNTGLSKPVGEILGNSYPLLINVECMAHTLQRVCRFCLDTYPEVMYLVYEMNRFLSDAYNMAKFKSFHTSFVDHPNIRFDRPSTWIEAACFYSMYYEHVDKFIKVLSDNCGNIKEIWAKNGLKSMLAIIHTSCANLIPAIEQLESQDLFRDAVKHFNETLEKVLKSFSFKSKLLGYIKQTKEEIGHKVIDEMVKKEVDFTLRYFQYAPVAVQKVQTGSCGSDLFLSHYYNPKTCY